MTADDEHSELVAVVANALHGGEHLSVHSCPCEHQARAVAELFERVTPFDATKDPDLDWFESWWRLRGGNRQEER